MGTINDFELGDVVLMKDTYYNRKFTAHCIKRSYELNNDFSVKLVFVFAADGDEDHDITYTIGEETENNYIIENVIGNILHEDPV